MIRDDNMLINLRNLVDIIQHSAQDGVLPYLEQRLGEVSGQFPQPGGIPSRYNYILHLIANLGQRYKKLAKKAERSKNNCIFASKTIRSMQYHIFAPYRVCPLGAHVDHQHGLVTGFAIDKGVDLWFDIAPDAHVHLESKTFEGLVDFEIDSPTQVKERHWGDYARGAKFALRKRFELKHGINGVIQGSLPIGGLSSSAAVLIAYVMAFAKANDITLQPFEVVKIASEADSLRGRARVYWSQQRSARSGLYRPGPGRWSALPRLRQ